MKNIFILLLIFLSTVAVTEVAVAQPSCLVTHYSRSHYLAGSQNWSIDMDQQGFVYVANNDGLLKYDGIRWKVFPMPLHTIVRSVLVSPDNRVYTGSNEEFGYWTKDLSQGLKYTSLVPLLKDFNLHNNEIWKIVQSQNKVYFQGFSSLFVYDQHTVKPIKLPGSIVFLLKAGGHLFAHSVQGDLYEVVDDKMVNINQSKLLYGTEVKTILPFKAGSFLVGTSSKGVFLLDKNGIIPWDVPANPLLKEFQINNGVIFDDKIVFGTIVNGVFILDKAGNLLNHINTGNDLQNNTVLSLYNDNNQSIWVGLDNGIDNISFNNPVDDYQGSKESLGAVYAAALYNEILYVGTNRGIFTYLKKGDRFLYNGFLKNSQGQVWQLKVIDGTLFCGHTNGTFKIENNILKPVSGVSGGYMLQKIIVKGQEYLIQSTYASLVIYKKSGNNWQYSHKVEGFLEPGRFIEADHLGNIWIGHSIKGLYRLRLSESLEKVAKKQYFDQKDELFANANIRVFKIANRVVFSDGKQLFTWDDLNQKMILYTRLNIRLEDFAAAVTVSAIDENNYWVVTKTEAALININEKKSLMLYRLILNQHNLALVERYENIVPLSENLHLICLDNGFAIFKKNMITGKDSGASDLVIRELACWDAAGNTLNKYLSGASFTLENAFNNITVSFSTLKNPCSRKLYQFKLEGIDSAWSKWAETNEAKYTRLPVGKYIFKVRTLTSNGTITVPVTLAFRVKPAWYVSFMATIIYIIVSIGIILAGAFYYRNRLARHHSHLDQIASEKRNAEKKNSEQEIMKLHNEKLQAEIAHKTMQLADSTMSVIKKNEMLIEIKDELAKQKEELGPRYPVRYLQRFTTLIDKNISNDNDWEIFEVLFDQAHGDFFKRLKQSFPHLTQSDLKLCAYLKLNLSSKEIVPLLNISIRGVEIRRYRLRKRLELSSDKNLVEYIMQF